MAKKKNPNDFDDIVVKGCLIKANTVYEIVSKTPPDNSPELLVKLKSMKMRTPGMGNTVTLTQSDTGFFPASPCFTDNKITQNDWSERERLSNLYYKVFAEPMKMYISEIDRIKTPADNEFFDKFYATEYSSVTIEEGMQFDTSNPSDRFRLYIAIQEGQLTMKGKAKPEQVELGILGENNHLAPDAQYCYISLSETKSKQELDSELDMNSSYTFGRLLREDRDILISLLNYISIPVKSDASQAELNSLYKVSIENRKDKMNELLRHVSRYDSKDTKSQLLKELEIHDMIRSKFGRKLLISEHNTFYFRGVPLGSNNRSIVASLVKEENEDLLKEFKLAYNDSINYQS